KAWVESKPLQPPGVLIIGPSNYPLQLVLKPLAGVGGMMFRHSMKDCLPVKSTLSILEFVSPYLAKFQWNSELTPNVANALEECIRQYFDPSVVKVVLGAVPETKALLSTQWAKVLFTGSERVGKLVAQACAETLTPCILECGGKSATVVDETVPTSQLQNVADRIVFAKFFNSGQVCIAPDTMFVHESHAISMKDALLRAMDEQLGKDPQSGEMARIVNKPNAQRLVDIIKEEEFHASTFNSDTPDRTEIVVGGSKASDVDQRYVAPTLVLNPSPSGRLVKEEVFGPILPIRTFASRDEALETIQAMNKTAGIPLFLYVFTTKDRVFRTYTEKCRSGGAVRNDVLIQLANTEQPLGGLGSSGYGRYFGKYSYDAFTHKYPVTYRPLGSVWDFGNLRCHPYAGWKSKVLEDYLLYLPKVPSFLTPSRLLLIPLIIFMLFKLPSISTMIPPSVKLWLASALEDMARMLRDSPSS
ncbi:MAG: hypothetical protein SGILL_010764, partial [Bacillariaceae sp.]